MHTQPHPTPARADPMAAAARHLQQRLQMRDACQALWLATLALMAAYMRNQAPAHRRLLAARIARNLHTLHQEAGSFAPQARERFAVLAARWQALEACAAAAGRRH